MTLFSENLEAELESLNESELTRLMQLCRSALQARRSAPQVVERENEIAREFWQANGLEEGKAVPWERPQYSFNKFPTHAIVEHQGKHWVNEGDGPTDIEPGSEEDRHGVWQESFAHLKAEDGEEPQGPLFDPDKEWEPHTIVYWEGHNYLTTEERPEPGSSVLPGEDNSLFVRMFPDDAE